MGWRGDTYKYSQREIKKAIADSKSGEGGSDAKVDIYLARKALGLELSECRYNIIPIQNWLNGKRDRGDLVLERRVDGV